MTYQKDMYVSRNVRKISISILLVLTSSMFVACGGETSMDQDPTIQRSFNSAPVFLTESNLTSQENVMAVTTITAGDAENSDLMFAVVGGADAEFFQVDSLTGELRFRAIPDFDVPRDSNANNTYVVVVSVTDGESTTSQTFTVSVIDYSVAAEVPAGYVKTLKLDWPAVKDVKHYELWVSSDGEPDYIQVQTDITETHTDVTLPVHLTDWINSRYVVDGYNDQGKVFRSDPVDIRTVMLDSIGYIKASNTDKIDVFGSVVTLSADGQTLAVGAPREASAATNVNGDQDDNTAGQAGAVYVFTRVGPVWVQQAYIKVSNMDPDGEAFGTSLALSADGQILVVGAPWEDGVVTGGGSNLFGDKTIGSGAVYVFARVEETWTQQTSLNASNAGIFDNFGESVAVSADGKTVVVGAPHESAYATGINDKPDDMSAWESGAAYVFIRAGATWTQQAYLKASNTDAFDNFGESVAISADGRTVAIGAPNESSAGGDPGDNSTDGAGAVYVFNRADATWTQAAYLKASNAGIFDNFGESVSLSVDGQIAVIGAPGVRRDVIGGEQGDNSDTDAGAVYVFAYTETAWRQQSYLRASNSNGDSLFGYSVALSADALTLAVGAPSEDSSATGINGDQEDSKTNGAGAVYLFTRNETVWKQQAYVKASNTDNQDAYGYSVALSADGRTLAVGAPFEDSTATGINGDQRNNDAPGAGAVYLY